MTVHEPRTFSKNRKKECPGAREDRYERTMLISRKLDKPR